MESLNPKTEKILISLGGDAYQIEAGTEPERQLMEIREITTVRLAQNKIKEYLPEKKGPDYNRPTSIYTGLLKSRIQILNFVTVSISYNEGTNEFINVGFTKVMFGEGERVDRSLGVFFFNANKIPTLVGTTYNDPHWFKPEESLNLLAEFYEQFIKDSV